VLTGNLLMVPPEKPQCPAATSPQTAPTQHSFAKQLDNMKQFRWQLKNNHHRHDEQLAPRLLWIRQILGMILSGFGYLMSMDLPWGAAACLVRRSASWKVETAQAEEMRAERSGVAGRDSATLEDRRPSSDQKAQSRGWEGALIHRHLLGRGG